MRLQLKNATVNLSGLCIETIHAIMQCLYVFKKLGYSTMTITSANDGDHKTRSLHYEGRAFDVRTRNVTDVFALRDEIQELLGPDYDVILEVDHIHVEHDPRL